MSDSFNEQPSSETGELFSARQPLTRNPAYVYRKNPYGKDIPPAELKKVLPPLLDDDARRQIIGGSYTVQDTRYFELAEEKEYRYGDMSFSVPAEVVFPGEVSGFIFDKIWTGEIPLVGKRFLAMGVGAGVELVLAYLSGADAVVGSDIDPVSVEASRRNCARHVPSPERELSCVVSDLLNEIPDRQFDVICFNGPFGVPVISNDRLERMAYSGPGILQKFLQQMNARDFLAPGGSLYIVCSNTTDIPLFVDYAVEAGLVMDVPETISAPPGHRYESIITHFIRFTRPL